MSSVAMLPYTSGFILLCVLVSMALTIALLLVSLDTNAIYGQVQNQKLGVNITSPERGKTIPINTNLTVSGKSTDNPAADDCQVAVIVNNVKPYQPATANGSTGAPSDYSRWYFILGSNYTSIKEGVNEITAKLTCLPNATKWYSVNVTGVTSTQTRNVTTTTTTTTTTITSPSQSLTSNQERLGPLQQPLPKPSSPPPALTPSPEGLSTDDLMIQESVQGGNEPDIIEGTLFADNIDGGNGDDRIQGSDGDDTINGGNGDDYLQGNEGDDNLSGVNGDDTLFGAEGDDTLNGGNGADSFSCDGGNDTITDFSTTQGDVTSDNCEVY